MDETATATPKKKRTRTRKSPQEAAVSKLANLPFDAIKPTAEALCRDYEQLAEYFAKLLTEGLSHR